MAKLGKTEQYILDQLAEHGGKWGYTHGYRTGRKKGGYGSRLVNAACKLRDRGLVKLTVQGSHVDSRQAHSDHWTEVLVERLDSTAPALTVKMAESLKAMARAGSVRVLAGDPRFIGLAVNPSVARALARMGFIKIESAYNGTHYQGRWASLTGAGWKATGQEPTHEEVSLVSSDGTVIDTRIRPIYKPEEWVTCDSRGNPV
jgi:hypothetical protein